MSGSVGAMLAADVGGRRRMKGEFGHFGETEKMKRSFFSILFFSLFGCSAGGWGKNWW